MGLHINALYAKIMFNGCGFMLLATLLEIKVLEGVLIEPLGAKQN